MRTSFVRDSDLMSPLAFDLAVSRLSLAALNAVAGISPTLEDRSCSARLRDSIGRKLALLQGEPTIPVEVVPQEAMRQELETTLTTLAHLNSVEKDDLTLLERLFSLLGRLEEDALSRTDAKNLLDALLHVGPRVEARTAVPDIELALQADRVD